MTRQRRFLIGGAIIAVTLGGLVVTGVRQSVVYFVTPTELLAATASRDGKAYRLGGMVVKGSLEKNPGTLEHRFQVTDGKASVRVVYRGIPPDLFNEGRGAVLEGTLAPDGVFRASHIMAKHSEEYTAPHDGQPGYQELLQSLRGDAPGPSGKP